jgi:antitoxin YxxD
MFENIQKNKSNTFYSVSDEKLKEQEDKIGIIFPELFRKFLLEIGYGFLETKNGNINRIMDPKSIAEFRNKDGQFSNIQDIEIYNEFDNDKLVFFESNETAYFSIGFSKENYGQIYYYDKKVANNLQEFLLNYSKDERSFE